MMGTKVGRLKGAVLFGLTTLAVVTFVGMEASAIWAKLSLEELVKGSEVIAVGELVAVQEEPGSPTDVGTIKIEEVIQGSKDLKSVSLAMPARRGLMSSDMIFYKVGQRGVWFLRRDTNAAGQVFLADHPQRFQDVKEVEGIKAFVKSRAAQR